MPQRRDGHRRATSSSWTGGRSEDATAPCPPQTVPSPEADRPVPPTDGPSRPQVDNGALSVDEGPRPSATGRVGLDSYAERSIADSRPAESRRPAAVGLLQRAGWAGAPDAGATLPDRWGHRRIQEPAQRRRAPVRGPRLEPRGCQGGQGPRSGSPRRGRGQSRDRLRRQGRERSEGARRGDHQRQGGQPGAHDATRTARSSAPPPRGGATNEAGAPLAAPPRHRITGPCHEAHHGRAPVSFRERQGTSSAREDDGTPGSGSSA
jgi:hypothetical protein